MDFAQEVKAAADIVSVVGSHVRLKRQGGNRYVGLCPFHQEKTPSFSVHGGLQIYKCFGCGKSGDVFSFLMEIQGLSFFEALKALAEQQGKEMPRRGKSPGADAAARKRDALLRIHKVAQSFYASQLRSPKGAAALRYLRERGLGSREQEEFGLGYAPVGNALVRHLRGQGFRRGDVLNSGLVGQSEKDRSIYDRFRDRLMFPIHSDGGKLIAYGGRVRQPEKQPKYLNSPETPIYRKNSILFNLHRARIAMRQEDMAVLVEGYMDVIGVWRAGVRNAVATCGTALTARQISMIRRHCDTVVVNFDSDRAGRAAAERAVELLLRDGMNVSVLELPGDMDPDEFCKAKGADAYLKELRNAPRYFFWLLDRSRARFDLRTSDGRTAAFERLLQSVVLLPDEIQRVTTVTELADHIGLQHGVALNRLRQRAGQPRSSRRPSPVAGAGLSPGERLLVVLLANSRSARDELLDDTAKITSQGLPSRRIFAAMRATNEAEGDFPISAVEGRLEDADRERLAQLLFDRDRPPPTISEGREALDALRRQVTEGRYRDVRRQFAAAERDGDQKVVIELLREKVALERELGLGRRQGA
ncbi:MAG: DNA primase [Bryobacterales bacterium]|nr:DNA primase [Bryobacterales bacterium]MDE0625030.1 DNA primase [Bryobacterales bacterium]